MNRARRNLCRHGSRASALTGAHAACEFCREAAVAPGVLAETAHFTVVCDRSPLLPGHLLLISRAHLACYAALPRGLYAEFATLKQRVGAFLAAVYGPPVFLERGLHGQATPHAHLHALPRHSSHPDAPVGPAAGTSLRGLAGLRRWYERHGPYLYVECDEHRRVLAPGRAIEPPWPASYVTTRASTPTSDQVPEITRSVREAWRRYEQTHGRPTTRIIACFLEYGGKVCLLKRSEAVGSSRGKWHVVSGYLPDDKDPLAHAYDELAEETGLDRGAVALRRHAGPLLFDDRGGGRPWEVDVYLFAAASPDLQLNWEHDEYAWIAPAAIAEYDALPWLPVIYRALTADA